ncbi:hypothetical protein BO83DRAFT_326904 [Aspergillus eucalypticola CBS 122712]|uniref:Uncharacterized protein n=1 Tax=Aspergillus eucalypticola (strain CBS 122712 / IBT 29274) TaxID=1448314 RepID=A0A317UN74_ASPEC|nr:uncharacterized protein BO83DRAFT_326904 [Aspergillus eucalypticola CBS 122712]PWY62027.1 hypothetical protein BO83DRAFT_326904 [Aspergillus eucalypticola CBS 122712]
MSAYVLDDQKQITELSFLSIYPISIVQDKTDSKICPYNDNNNTNNRRVGAPPPLPNLPAGRRPPVPAPPPPPDLEQYWASLYEGLPVGANPTIPARDLGRLRPFVHTDVGLQVLARPGAQSIEFRHGRIHTHQITMHRASYINALLIQSQGIRPPAPCSRCRDGTGGVFPEYHHLPGAFGGICANCKWPDAGSSCTVRDSAWGVLREAQPPMPVIGRGLPAPGASCTDPIVVGEEGEEEEEEEEVVVVPVSLTRPDPPP